MTSLPNNLPLTISNISNSLLLFQLETTSKSSKCVIYESSDAKSFKKTKKAFKISNLSKYSLDISNFKYFSITKTSEFYVGIMGFLDSFYSARSPDGVNWEINELIQRKITGMSVVSSSYKNNGHVAYWSDDSIHIGFSRDLASFTMFDDPLYSPPLNHNQSLWVLNTFSGVDEIFVVFVMQTRLQNGTYYSLSLAVFSKSDPRKIAWRMVQPFWSITEEFVDRSSVPVALVAFNGAIYSFWFMADGELINVSHPLLSEIVLLGKEAVPNPQVNRSDKNPILSPKDDTFWESRAVFNPAALYDEEEKKLHLLYRAVGEDWRSVLGYARSSDGISIDRPYDFPAYFPRKAFEGAHVMPDPKSPYTSGPGSGGCEDPRLTKIGDMVYLTYVAYDGYSGPRVAMSSISFEDFVNNSWNWSDPVLISKPGVIDKNACIFPEKISGKYVILHRIFPDILIDFVDSLDFDGNTYLKGEFKIKPRHTGWDSRKVGAGPPPIKTNKGWLLIYHAVDDKRDSQYQVGAMLLDLKDPTRIIARSSNPILRPLTWYENEGYKSGVVYPCGAAVIEDTLHVYYGGADTYICAATAHLPTFLDSIVRQEYSPMQRISFI